LTQRQAVRHLGSYLLRREWIGILVTFLFALYTGGFSSFSVNALVGGEEIPRFMAGIVDWMYLMVLPVFGTIMNKTIFATWRDDVYSKRIAHWLTMPIPPSAIVQVRILQTAIMLPAISLVFFLFQYVLAPELRANVPVTNWLETSVIWMCYSFVISAVYGLAEFGYNGKLYVKVCLGHMLITAVISIVLTSMDVHLFQAVIDFSRNGNMAVLVGASVMLAVLATWFGYRATLARLRTRSLTF
jgi:hypothetical protein